MDVHLDERLPSPLHSVAKANDGRLFRYGSNGELFAPSYFWSEKADAIEVGWAVYRNDGMWGYGAPLTFPSSKGSQDIIIADFNNDLKPDVALANFEANDVAVLMARDEPRPICP